MLYLCKNHTIINYVQPTFDSENKIEVTEKGVYTYQYNYYLKDGVVYTNFKLLLWDEVVGESIEANMDEAPLVTDDTLNPVSEHATKVRTVLFNNMNIESGVNVYTKLPEKPEQENSEETLPEETEESKDEIKDEEENLKTADGIILTVSTLAISVVVAMIAKKKLA